MKLNFDTKRLNETSKSRESEEESPTYFDTIKTDEEDPDVVWIHGMQDGGIKV